MNSNKSRRINWKLAVAIQACSAVALVSGWLLLPPNAQRRILADANNVRPTADVVISNLTPAVVRPLYDDASVVSDEDLAAVALVALAVLFFRAENAEFEKKVVDRASEPLMDLRNAQNLLLSESGEYTDPDTGEVRRRMPIHAAMEQVASQFGSR